MEQGIGELADTVADWVQVMDLRWGRMASMREGRGWGIEQLFL